MRIAAGILMIIYGVVLGFYYGGLGLGLSIQYGGPSSSIAHSIFELICGLFSLSGGLFCLMRRYWKVCFGSALLLPLAVIDIITGFRLTGFQWAYHDVTRLVISILVMIGGILPIIFVCLRRREWQKSQT